MGEWRYNSIQILTTALDESKWSAPRLGRLIPRESVPGIRSGPQRRSGRCDEKTNSQSLPEIEPRASSPKPT
jgi:hypothetical protein